MYSMKVISKWIQRIRRLFKKRSKVNHIPEEKVNEDGANDVKMKDENEEQVHLQAELKDSHQILLSLHTIFKKHAECTENLLSQIEKLSDVIEKTKMAKMEVSEDFTPLTGSVAPSTSSFCVFGIRLPPLKNPQHSSVNSSLHPDDAKSAKFPKLAWAANKSISSNTEETFLTRTVMTETELQTVDESTELETKSLVIESIQNEPSMAKMEVSEAFTPLPGSVTPTTSSFRFFGIRLPPLKKPQHSSVNSSLHPDDAQPSKFPKLAWAANKSISSNTEETFLTGTVITETELQTVDEYTEHETKSLVIENVQNEPHDGKICRLDIEYAEIDKWLRIEQKEKLKLKLEMAEAQQKRQLETEELKLKLKFLEKEAKREKQERKQKLNDLEKEVKNEKAMLLLKLKELKKKEKMERKEECNEDKMEQDKKDDGEKGDEVQNKNVFEKMERKEECNEDKMEQDRKDDGEEGNEVQNKNVFQIFRKLAFGRRKAVV